MSCEDEGCEGISRGIWCRHVTERDDSHNTAYLVSLLPREGRVFSPRGAAMGYILFFVVFAMLILEGFLNWLEENQSHRHK